VFLEPVAGLAFAFFVTTTGLDDAIFMATSSGAEIEPGAPGPSPPHPIVISAHADRMSMAAPTRAGNLGATRNLDSGLLVILSDSLIEIG
jgi:hypothetical protein